jgi:hypothetical protein
MQKKRWMHLGSDVPTIRLLYRPPCTHYSTEKTNGDPSGFPKVWQLQLDISLSTTITSIVFKQLSGMMLSIFSHQPLETWFGKEMVGVAILIEVFA